MIYSYDYFLGLLEHYQEIKREDKKYMKKLAVSEENTLYSGY